MKYRTFHVRMTEEEYQYLKQISQESSINEYIRLLILREMNQRAIVSKTGTSNTSSTVYYFPQEGGLR